MDHHVHSSSDIYSFGVVLLQILSRRRVNNLELTKPMPLSKMTYASILYHRIPAGFQIILRGKMLIIIIWLMILSTLMSLYIKPAAYADAKDPNMPAKVQFGFVKDAVHHIDIQGFNAYHKNRIIKNGVLEANFVEPTHDKQGFERTITLSRLEARLQHFQKIYWSSNCHLIGYSKIRSHAKKAAAAGSAL